MMTNTLNFKLNFLNPTDQERISFGISVMQQKPVKM